MKNIPENFCFKPWTGIYVDYNSVGPCCVNTKLYGGKSINNYMTSSKLKELKDSFIKNEKHPSCYSCWKEESIGVKSVRQKSGLQNRNDYFQFTIRLSNKCNFKCRMCTPGCSSAWEKDIEALDIKNSIEHPNKDKNIFDQESYERNINLVLEIAKLKNIDIIFIGGEPLISEEFLYFLDKCKNYKSRKNITLRINTNLSVYKYKNIDYSKEFNNFNKVYLHASIDGLDLVGEYIRKGYKQDKFDYNLKKLKKFVQSFNLTIQAYNIYNLPNFYKFAELHKKDVVINYLHYPTYLSLSILDEKERIKILEFFKKENFEEQSIINAIKNEKYNKIDIKKFIKYTDSLDRIWKTNFTESIPELKIWYERIKNEKCSLV